MTISWWHDFAEFLGFPTSRKLAIFVAEHRQLRIQLPQRAPDIAAGSIVRWDEWGVPSRLRWPRRAPGVLLGWRKERRGYHSFEQQVPELEKFGTYDECENWRCDIRVVAGFSGSKADLSAFQSLDSMVEATAQNLIEPTTPQKLRENLSYPGVRIMRTANQGDYFARYMGSSQETEICAR